MEKWKDILGYEGLYKISNYGNVTSVARVISNGNGIRKSKDLLKTHVDNGHGYFRVCLSKKNTKKYVLVHILIANHFIENPNNLPIINHKDGNKKNNTIDNLEWCTWSHNNKHGYDTGLIKSLKGENHKRAKLTNKDVLEIREHLKQGVLSNVKISKLYNISSNSISGIKTKATWGHL